MTSMPDHRGRARRLRRLAGLTQNIQHEADEPVVLGERNKVRVDKHNVLEVVDDRLAVEEVVGDDEEVPVERLAPVASRLDTLGTLCDGQ